MATPKKRRRKVVSLPAWYVAGGDPAKRFRAVGHARADIKLVRQYLYGFEARDGVNASRPWEIPVAKLKRVQRLAAELRVRLKAPHVQKSVPRRDAKSRRRLVKYFPQAVSGPRVKRFIVPILEPGTSRLSTARGNLTFLRDVPGGEFRFRYFPVPRRLRTFDRIIKWLNEQLPAWPKGTYSVIMSQHGMIQEQAERGALVQMMRDWFAQYRGVHGKEETSENILGFVWIDDSFDKAARLRAHRKTASQQMAENIERERQKRNRKWAAEMKRRGILK